ncbi:hypothetical protein ACFQPF_04730 [Fictibacillus iocasae]|uniref:Uncharacterized protein n=1 Tax=Fictibacillus iocasae TaxID=2715437 RepID=A0ABW2NP56_9BACL
MKKQPGFEAAMFFLSLLFLSGIYQTAMVWGKIDMFFEQESGLTTTSFLSSMVLFWSLTSAFWILALKVLDVAHKTQLFKTSNALFGMIFLFFAIPLAICSQIYHSLGMNGMVSTLSLALLIMTLISFVIGFVFKFRKAV